MFGQYSPEGDFMKTKTQIYMDYQMAISQADACVALADKLNNEAVYSWEECLREAARGWTGESAAAFTSHSRMVQEKLRGSAAELKKTGEAIRSIAGNTLRSELRALELAKLRNY